jgi:hypothetical protein
MWILVLEAMGALSLLLFIVWWTLGPTHRRERDELRRLGDAAAHEAADEARPTPSPAQPPSSATER